METYRRSDNKKPEATQVPRSDNTAASNAPSPFSDGPTMVWPVQDDPRETPPGTLEGDDYQLEYYEDGYPSAGVS